MYFRKFYQTIPMTDQLIYSNLRKTTCPFAVALVTGKNTWQLRDKMKVVFDLWNYLRHSFVNLFLGVEFLNKWLQSNPNPAISIFERYKEFRSNLKQFWIFQRLKTTFKSWDPVGFFMILTRIRFMPLPTELKRYRVSHETWE